MQNLLLKWMDWRDMLIHKILNESRNDMKRFCKTFIVLFFISIVVTTISCNSKQDAISRLEALYEELQQNGDEYTADDWDAVIAEMNDIDDVCSKQISYELSFFIGNIRDLLADNTGFFKDELEDQLSLMQKKVKYGVPSLTALSICEKVFYDRLLAIKISGVLEDDDISEEEIILSIQQKKEEIVELLNDYPEFFRARINSAIK